MLPAHALHEMAVPWHVDDFEKLMEGRAVSLSSFHYLPPFRYSHMLSEDAATARAAQELALEDFEALLNAEAAEAAGFEVEPLACMHWKLNPMIRDIYLAHEQDEAIGRSCQPHSAAMRLQKLWDPIQQIQIDPDPSHVNFATKAWRTIQFGAAFGAPHFNWGPTAYF